MVDRSLSFGNVVKATKKSSNDSFTVRHNRRSGILNTDVFVWNVKFANNPRIVNRIDMDGNSVEIPVIPGDLLAAVLLGVKTGQWTETTGIIAAFDGISGRNPTTPGLAIKDVNKAGLTGLLRHTSDLLSSQTLTAKETAELEAAMIFFMPNQVMLDQISKPSSRSFNQGNLQSGNNAVMISSESNLSDSENPVSSKALATQAGINTSECAIFGIDESKIGADGKCFIYDKIISGGHTLKVFYPNSWKDSSNDIARVDLTLAAMIKSNEIFASMATIGDINLVFSLLSSGTTLASQSYFDLQKPCPLTVYPAASFNTKDEVYQQTIAHEVFHCVQDRSFITSPYGRHGWWLEGSAEYFSNVVYPFADDEHRTIEHFDIRSSEEDLTAMSYENTVFFQYYANRRGNAGTIKLLETVSNAGGTLESIASVTGTKLWQDFVIAFMAEAILDSGTGKLAAGRYTTNDEFIKIQQSIIIEFGTDPMIATRYAIQYKEIRRYTQNPESEQGLPLHSFSKGKNRRNENSWSLLPIDLRTGCVDHENYLLVTTTVDEPGTFTIDVTKTEEATCDACMLGAWELDLNTFKDYINGSFSANGVTGPITNIRGSYQFDFNEGGAFSSFRQPIIVTVSQDGFSLPFEIVGEETGNYFADSEDITVSNLVGNASAGAAGGPLIGGPPTFFSGATSPYFCKGDSLLIFNQTYAPLELDRINKLPVPDSVEVLEGTRPVVDIDTDGDGIGNQRDLDDDGDGFSDIDEINALTNPLDPDSVPTVSPPAHAAFKIKIKSNNNPGDTPEFYINAINNQNYSYHVDCNNDGVNEATAQTSGYLCQYQSEGEYIVSITGIFPQFSMHSDRFIRNHEKLLAIEQWGTGEWLSFAFSFSGAINLTLINAQDTPNLSKALSLQHMFSEANQFNSDINNWGVSTVTDMRSMFSQANSFDQNLGNWDIRNVTRMSSMFDGVHLSVENYNNLLLGWSQLPEIKADVIFDGGNSQYSGQAVINARNFLSTDNNGPHWKIQDGGLQ
ncbi:MAG: BspA family leucine-rich repeat surface protein [Gammaproteobacteria bacterium]